MNFYPHHARSNLSCTSSIKANHLERKKLRYNNLATAEQTLLKTKTIYCKTYPLKEDASHLNYQQLSGMKLIPVIWYWYMNCSGFMTSSRKNKILIYRSIRLCSLFVVHVYPSSNWKSFVASKLGFNRTLKMMMNEQRRTPFPILQSHRKLVSH